MVVGPIAFMWLARRSTATRSVSTRAKVRAAVDAKDADNADRNLDETKAPTFPALVPLTKLEVG